MIDWPTFLVWLPDAPEVLAKVPEALVTLAATFLGAWYAFKLTDRDKARETTSEQVSAINRAQFVLIQHFNQLDNHRRQFVEPFRSDPERYIKMRASLPLRPKTTLNVEGLLFILETDDRELVFELLIEEQRFETVLEAINHRSALHLDVVQPKLSAAGIAESEYVPEKALRALGEPLARHLQRATDDAIEHLDLTIKSSADLIARFHKGMKARFPKHTIIRVGGLVP